MEKLSVLPKSKNKVLFSRSKDIKFGHSAPSFLMIWNNKTCFHFFQGEQWVSFPNFRSTVHKNLQWTWHHDTELVMSVFGQVSLEHIELLLSVLEDQRAGIVRFEDSAQTTFHYILLHKGLFIQLMVIYNHLQPFTQVIYITDIFFFFMFWRWKRSVGITWSESATKSY